MITIQTSVVDVMVVGGLDFATVAKLRSEERTALLRPHLETMAGRFRLLDENEGALAPADVRVQIPDDSEMSPLLEQQQMTIVLEYVLVSPPASLTFWQSFGEGNIGDVYPAGQEFSPHQHPDWFGEESAAVPIYAALTIRQNKELVLLPSELGPGFSIRFPFTWNDPIVPLAHRSSFGSATPGWDNRPASGYLTIEESVIRWKLFLTLEAVAKSLPEFDQAGERGGLREALCNRLTMTIDGQRREPGDVSFGVHAMTAMAVLHRRPLPVEASQPGMVVLEVTYPITDLPREVELAWELFSDAIPLLLSEIRHGDDTDFSVLTKDSQVLRWQAE